MNIQRVYELLTRGFRGRRMNRFVETFQPTAETTVLNRKYSRYRTIAGIPTSERPQFDGDVDKELEAIRAEASGEEDEGDLRTWRQYESGIHSLKSASPDMLPWAPPLMPAPASG